MQLIQQHSFFMKKMMQLIQLHVFHSGGAAWGPWAQAPPEWEKMRKTKPMPMAMPMPGVT